MTNEESINTLNQTISQGSHSAFMFLGWIFRRNAEKKRAKPIKETEDFMSDACSRYRGGYYDPKNENLTAGIMSDLSGGKTAESAPFIFMGDRSDLSVFWEVAKPGKRSAPEQRVAVPREMINNIPDEAVRKNTIAAFAKAQADGMVRFDGRVYNLTEAGKHYILRSDFILNRLTKEYNFFCTASAAMEKEAAGRAAAEKEAWIDAQLRSRGIDPERYAGCRRITIDRESLQAERVGEDWLVNLPRTGRQQKVILPKESVVEVNDTTLIAFIEPGQTYPGRGIERSVTAEDLMAHFDDKTETRRPSVDNIKKAAEKEPFEPAAWADPTADAKLKAGETVFAPNHFENSLDLHPYTVDRALEDPAGQIWYKLSCEDLPDQILPEDSLGKFLFTDEAQGKAYLAAHGKEAADYADELLAQTMGERVAGQQETVTYSLALDKSKLIAENDEICRIRVPGKQVEQMILPKADVVQTGEKLQITLHSDQQYKVITGAYGYNTSGDGLAKLSGAKKVQTAPVAEQKLNTPAQKAAEKVFGIQGQSDADSVRQAAFLTRNAKRTTKFMLKLEKGNLLADNGTVSRIRLSDGKINEALLPSKDVLREGEMLQITLHGEQSYNVIGGSSGYSVTGTELAQASGAELLSLPAPAEAEVPAAEAPKTQGKPYKVVKSPGKNSSSSFDRDEFFEAAVRDGLRRHGKLPDNGQMSLSSSFDRDESFEAAIRDSLRKHGKLPDNGQMSLESGQEAAKLFGASAGSAASQTAGTAAAAATTATAHTAVNAAVAAIPVPEPVTMGAKTIYAAVSQATTATVKAGQAAVQSAPKLVQTIGKE